MKFNILLTSVLVILHSNWAVAQDVDHIPVLNVVSTAEEIGSIEEGVQANIALDVDTIANVPVDTSSPIPLHNVEVDAANAFLEKADNGETASDSDTNIQSPDYESNSGMLTPDVMTQEDQEVLEMIFDYTDSAAAHQVDEVVIKPAEDDVVEMLFDYSDPVAAEPVAVPEDVKVDAIKPEENEVVEMVFDYSDNAVAVIPVAADPVAAETVSAEPVATEPVAAEPVAAEPVAAEPVSADPVAAEPIAAEPVAAEPVAAEPVAAEPVAAEPVAAEPVSADPVAAEPIAVEPIAVEPIAVEFVAANSVVDNSFEASASVATEDIVRLDSADALVDAEIGVEKSDLIRDSVEVPIEKEQDELNVHGDSASEIDGPERISVDMALESEEVPEHFQAVPVDELPIDVALIEPDVPTDSDEVLLIGESSDSKSESVQEMPAEVKIPDHDHQTVEVAQNGESLPPPSVAEVTSEEINSALIQELQLRIKALTDTNTLLFEEIDGLKGRLEEATSARPQCDCPTCEDPLAEARAQELQISAEQLQQCTESLANSTLKLSTTERSLSAIEVKLKLAKNEVTMSRLTIENCQLTKEMVQMDCNENKTALESELVSLRKENKALKSSRGSGSCTTNTAGSTGGGSSGRSSFFGVFDRSASTASPSTSSATNEPVKTEAVPTGAVFEMPKAKTVDSTSYDSEAVESPLKGVLQQIQSSVKLFLMEYLLPGVSKLLQMRIKLAKTVLGGVWAVLSSVWTNALKPLYESTIQPGFVSLYTTQLAPFYVTQVGPTVNSVTASIVSWYTTNGWDAVYESSLAPWVEEVVLTFHYVSYFTVKLLTSEDLVGAFVRLGIDLHAKLNEVSTELHGVPAVQSALGSRGTVYLVVVTVISAIVTWLLYFFRRIVKSLVAMVLLVLLLPVLLVLLVLAKLWALIVPGQKQGQKKSSHGGKKKHSSAPSSAIAPPVVSAASSMPLAAPTAATAAPVPAPAILKEERKPFGGDQLGQLDSPSSRAAEPSRFQFEPREAQFPQQQKYGYQQPLHQPPAPLHLHEHQQMPQQQQQYPPQRSSETSNYAYNPPSPSGPPLATNRSLPSPFAYRGSSASRGNNNTYVSSSASVGSLHSQHQPPPSRQYPLEQPPLPQQQSAPPQSLAADGPPPVGGYNNLPSPDAAASTGASMSPVPPSVNSGYMVADEDFDLA